MRTSSETVALGKAEAPGSVGGPTAGGRLRRLVMKCQGDRVEHVLPMALLPAPILSQVDAEGWKAVSDSDGDLRLLGLAVAGDRGPYALRRIHCECGVVASGEIPRGARELMKLIEPWHGMTVGLLDHNDVGPVGTKPRVNVLARGREPFILRDTPQPKHTAGHEPPVVKDGIAEFSKSRVEGENGVILLSHGV